MKMIKKVSIEYNYDIFLFAVLRLRYLTIFNQLKAVTF